MLRVNFTGYNSYITDSLYQWDLNQVFSIEGLKVDVAPVIHFSNKCMSEAIVVQSKMDDNGVITCEVPNALLQFSCDVIAYLCSSADQKSKAYEKIVIPIIPRTKPVDYLFTDNVPILTYEAIEADIQTYYNKAVSYANECKNNTSDELVEVKKEINVERKRIDNFASLPEGSTIGNVELVDIRVGSDGMVYANAGEAVRKQISGKTQSLTNLFNREDPDIVFGSYIQGESGSFTWVNNINFNESGYIPVQPGDKISRNYIPFNQNSVCFFDSDKNYISSISANNYIIVPDNDNIVYMRVPISAKYFTKYALYKGITTYNVYTEYNKPTTINVDFVLEDIFTDETISLKKLASQVEEEIKVYSENLFNSEDLDVRTGGYITLNNNWEEKEDYSESGYIPVHEGMKICSGTTDIQSKSLQRICYDSEKKYLKNESAEISGSFDYITIPSGVAYIRIPFKTENKDLYMVVEGTELPNKYIPFKTTPIKERVTNLESKTEELESYISTSQGIKTHWKNKEWYAYGTSLTSSSQGKYVPYVAEFSGLNVTNKGIPGGALVSNRNIYNALMDNTDGKINADLITIEVGANDGTAPMGDITSMDPSTFCGALNTCIKNILMNCPKAQVVLLNSTRGRYVLNNPDSLYDLDLERAGGGTTEERDEAIRRVAQANGIYYIPFGCGLGMLLFRLQSSDLYNVDNIHHTELGGYNLAQGVWGYLKNIPLWYTELPE